MLARVEKDRQRVPMKAGPECKVFCGGLNPRWTEDDLGSLMSAYGRVVFASVAKKPSGESKGYGFVTFRTPQEAASSLGTLLLGGKYVEVKPSLNQQNDLNTPASRLGPKPAKDRKPAVLGSSRISQDNNIHSSSLKKSSKLSKHSLLFESQASGSPHKSNHDSSVQINTFEITGNQDSSHSSSSSQQTSDNWVGSESRRKPVEKQGGISKLSKEYHPVVPLNLEPSFASQSMSLNAYLPMGFGFMGANYVSMGGTGLEMEPLTLQHTQQLGLARSAPDLRIKFFTFPGRD